MKEKKLIDKAKSFKTGNRKKMIINDEIIELSLAWANNELTMRQVAFALNKKTMKIWLTEIKAICPKRNELITWCGPNVEAIIDDRQKEWLEEYYSKKPRDFKK